MQAEAYIEVSTVDLNAASEAIGASDHVAGITVDMRRNYPHLFEALHGYVEEWVNEVDPAADFVAFTAWQSYMKGAYISYDAIRQTSQSHRVIVPDSVLALYAGQRLAFVQNFHRNTAVVPFLELVECVAEEYTPESDISRAFYVGMCDVVVPFLLASGQMTEFDIM